MTMPFAFRVVTEKTIEELQSKSFSCQVNAAV